MVKKARVNMMNKTIVACLTAGVMALTSSGLPAFAVAVSAEEYDEAWVDEPEMTDDELSQWVDEGVYDDYDPSWDEYYEEDDGYWEEEWTEPEPERNTEEAPSAAESTASTAATESAVESTASVNAESTAAGTASGQTQTTAQNSTDSNTTNNTTTNTTQKTESDVAAETQRALDGIAGNTLVGGSAGISAQTAGSTQGASAASAATDRSKEAIENALNLSMNDQAEWTYDAEADAWILSVVPAVAFPELEEKEGVSACVPGAYVTGIDTNADGTADVTGTSGASAKGTLVIDGSAQVTSSNGQVYTASTAPVIINTGAAGYSSQANQTASTQYAAEGYINVACGNRGKQDMAVDANGNTYYTGDAPSCLADQKSAIRFVKYNILLGNLPGSTDYFVSTGGSGGGAHAVMAAATSDNPDFYDYQIAVGAVGVYEESEGVYSTSVTIDGKEYEISDGVWGCMAYSPITPLAEADMAMAFEYTLDTAYEFNTPFQKQLASYLSEAYMDYINAKQYQADEKQYGFDLNGDGDREDVVPLMIEYDADQYADTNGYGGTYLTLYTDLFISNLQWYLDNLGYAADYTWFDENGAAMTDEAVAGMTAEEKAKAFIEGRYASSNAGGRGMGGPGMGRMTGQLPDGADGNFPGAPGEGGPDGTNETGPDGEINLLAGPEEEKAGTPDQGTTQAAGSTVDSSEYGSYADMVAAYKSDIQEIIAGDSFGKNLVDLYNPLNYIGAPGTKDPAWCRILMGASEGDMSMMSSMNLQLAFLEAGTDAVVLWQWDGGHVPSEILGDSFSLYVDQMYGRYADGAVQVTKKDAEPQTANGTETEANGKDISGFVAGDDLTNVSFSTADAAAYRTAGAAKAIPGFDVIDYGQEDYVFGSAVKDARHWNEGLLKILESHESELSPLFNAGE